MIKKSNKKSPAQLLADKLSYNRKNAWDHFALPADRKKIFDYANIYKNFISQSKTEYSCVANGVELLIKAGFKKLPENSGQKIVPGTKFFTTAYNRNLAAFVIGKKPLSEGLRLLISHIDSPHIDLKPQPLYEDEQLAFLKTHYYGGIKKYQWPTLPLALHGIIATQNGKVINISIGEKETDPVFMITDLLPHLARKQMSKKLSEGIAGEDLNLLVGSIPIKDKTLKDKVKLAILQRLYENYKITEEDLISAELQIVPAGAARDIGFDKSLLSAYGHDDRSCSYAALTALMACPKPNYTNIVFWLDKEEIGSTGITGAEGTFIERSIGRLLETTGYYPDEVIMRRVFEKSKAISTDVNVVLDPNFKSVSEPLNTARLGHGAVITKYTGHGGKYESSEATAEFLAEIRAIFNQAKIPWQTGEIGKVDEGGGGTIAKDIARRGIPIIDIGIGLLNMHAPWEIISKADLFCTYLAYKVFLEK